MKLTNSQNSNMFGIIYRTLTKIKLARSVQKKVMFFAALATLLGCTTVNHKVGEVLNLDTDIKIKMNIAGNVNPDESGKPSPVFVRLYELNNTAIFEKADFIDLYENDEKILGSSLVAKQELKRFIPGKMRIEELVLKKDTQYVALFAEFFRFKDARSKIVFPVTARNVVRNTISVEISENEIHLLSK
ncbi:MAG: type VI secretion system protein VasD [Lentisphaeria bacterium]|jgi:type VI secretion system protein VasD